VADSDAQEILSQVLIANDGEVIQRLRLSAAEAAQVVARDLGALQAEVKRLESLASEDLEDELRRRFEKLEERVAQLRRTLPVSLTIARLRRAVALLARLEAEGTLQNVSANSDIAKALALRLGRAVDELELLLREVQPTGA
jgi:predicted component of type VI protein secretion system